MIARPILLAFTLAFALTGGLLSGSAGLVTLRQYRKRQQRIGRFVARQRFDRPAPATGGAPHWLALAYERLLGTPVWPRPRSCARLALIALAATIGITGVLGLFVHAPVLVCMMVAPLSFAGISRMLANSDQTTLSDAFMKSFPDALDLLVRNLRIGQPLDTAITRVSEQLRPPVGTVFTEISQWMRLGLSLAEATHRVSRRIGMQEFEFFGAAMSIQHKAGGNFIEVAENLASIMRERQITLLRGRAASSQARITARILIAIPLGITGGFALFQPAYFTPLLHSVSGYELMLYAGSSFVAGVWFINKYLSRFLQV